MFSEDEIQITGKDKEILIKLNEKDGIIIYSKENLNIFAEKDMYIHSKEGSVEIAANAGIDLVCKESSIKMNGETLIKGKSIKMNK